MQVAQRKKYTSKRIKLKILSDIVGLENRILIVIGLYLP